MPWPRPNQSRGPRGETERNREGDGNRGNLHYVAVVLAPFAVLRIVRTLHSPAARFRFRSPLHFKASDQKGSRRIAVQCTVLAALHCSIAHPWAQSGRTSGDLAILETTASGDNSAPHGTTATALIKSGPLPLTGFKNGSFPRSCERLQRRVYNES